MVQKMQISDSVINKYKSYINFLSINFSWILAKEVLGSIRFSRDINKGKYKNTKFNQFLNYCTHNKNEIKGSPKIRMKAK